MSWRFSWTIMAIAVVHAHHLVAKTVAGELGRLVSLAHWAGERVGKMRKTTSLRKRLQNERIIIAPGAFNALTAKLIVQAGFEAVYVTGAGIANTLLGLPDVGLVSFGEMRDQIRYITQAVDIPVIADADTGYGNSINVFRTVRELEAVGIAAIQLEDQVSPKRCGHFEGKDVIPMDEMVGKIRAAVAARQDPDLVIIARTDTRAVYGLEDAILRAQAYARAGADMTFIEAPQTRDELEKIPRNVSVPQVANMVEGGLTPLLSATELEALGFKLMLHANCMLRAGILGMQTVLAELQAQGTTRNVLHQMISMFERNRVTDRESIKELERKFL